MHLVATMHSGSPLVRTLHCLAPILHYHYLLHLLIRQYQDTVLSRLDFTPSSPSPQPAGDEDTIKVYLLCVGIPKVELARGVFVSMDPLSKVDTEPLGPNFSKVFVELAKKSKALLEKPHHGIKTVGESVGRCVAWRFCDVYYLFILLVDVIECIYILLFIILYIINI